MASANTPNVRSTRERSYLRRLAPERYRGKAFVHWTMTIEHRATGWLDRAETHACFREIMLHAGFRFRLACPVYCLMPDHVHVLWIGFGRDDASDQRQAVRFLRRHFNAVLRSHGFALQRQAFDHVLREEERERGAFETVAWYIRSNPERAGVVEDGAPYRFRGCVVPGYPDLNIDHGDYWERFWSIWTRLCGSDSPPSE